MVTYVVNQHRTLVIFTKFLVSQYLVNQGGGTMCDSSRPIMEGNKPSSKTSYRN